MAKMPTSPSAGKANGPTASKKINSPSSNAAEQIQTLGGMPAEKKEPEINAANDPKARGYAPGSVHGV